MVQRRKESQRWKTQQRCTMKDNREGIQRHLLEKAMVMLSLREMVKKAQ
jgi:hypothetical protein